CVAQAFLDCTFQLGKRARFVNGSREVSHIWMPDASVESCHNLLKRLRGDQDESLNLDSPYHLASTVLGNLTPETSRNDRGHKSVLMTRLRVPNSTAPNRD